MVAEELLLVTVSVVKGRLVNGAEELLRGCDCWGVVTGKLWAESESRRHGTAVSYI
ncbi:hypothetical protein DPMN_050168 [Dreissena polymorpha]|uniref:Uncharacterized protein n=1 Tax=Dreissena polymorpha TaxID=45954 RepID=A0A9D4CG87_DREPO|nr:hypothetical protein DPMN_050168 [Dreissena polymorpha]